jgi:hypothetical protein
MFWD